MSTQKWLTRFYDAILPNHNDILFTTKIIDDVEDLLTKLPNLQPGEPYTTVNVYGSPITLAVPTISDEEYHVLVVNDYQTIAKAQSEKESAITDVDRVIYYLDTRQRVGQHACTELLSSFPMEETPYRYWHDRWAEKQRYLKVWLRTKKFSDEAKDYIYAFMDEDNLTNEQRIEDRRLLDRWSDKKEKLKLSLQKHKDKLCKVDQIVCFGLGPLNSRRPKYFVQHLAATTVRDEIQAMRDESGLYVRDNPVKILAQNPAYCKNCKEILMKELDIRAVTTFEGHRSLTENALTISIAPGAPVCQMVVDLLKPFGGPVAMICDAFGGNYLLPEEVPDGYYATDEPTRNMVEYRSRCMVEDLDDAMNVLGMTWDQFETRYPEKPGELKKKWARESKNVRALDKHDEMEVLDEHVQGPTKERQTLIELSIEEKEEFERCSELNHISRDVYFQDLALYVRQK